MKKAKRKTAGSRQKLRAGIKKLTEAGGIVTKAKLPEDPKSMTRPQKAAAISAFEKKLSRGDAALLDGVRKILDAKRTERKEGLKTWAVELSDVDFPVAVAAHDVNQKKEDEKLLDQMEKALKRTRTTAVRVARSHKNRH